MQLIQAARRAALQLSRSTRISSAAAVASAHARRAVVTMSFSSPYRWISANELAALLKNPTEKGKTAIVDVRDDDFEGGNITGALNVPSGRFESKVEELAKDTLKDKERVVLHCHLSQQRGPKAARIYGEELARQTQGQAQASTQEVLVLRDGFAGFGPKYKNDPALVEKWNEESWSYR